MKKLLAISLLLIASNSEADTIHLNAVARSQACAMNMQCQLTGYHDIEIINDSDDIHYYSYSYVLCTDNNDCRILGNIIGVQPHSKWNNHLNNWLITKFGYRGTHQLYATTKVWGYQNNEYQNSNVVHVQ